MVGFLLRLVGCLVLREALFGPGRSPWRKTQWVRSQSSTPSSEARTDLWANKDRRFMDRVRREASASFVVKVSRSMMAGRVFNPERAAEVSRARRFSGRPGPIP
jgi:hypothetical protein